MIQHIVFTIFTGIGLRNGFAGQEWYEHRIEIFKNYTLKSLLNQTNKNFIHWLAFRKEEIFNKNTWLLFDYLMAIKYPAIFTFYGNVMWDDKFPTNWKDRKANIKRIIRNNLERYNTPKMILLDIIESFKNKNKHQKQNLTKSLGALRSIKKDEQWVYLTRIDSDDMLDREAIDKIQKVKPEERKAIVLSGGYIYDSDSKQLAEWDPKTIPPFNTIIFPTETFWNPYEHFAYIRGIKSHEDISKIYKCEPIEGRNYCVLAHGKQISTIFNHPFRGKLVDNKIMKNYGI